MTIKKIPVTIGFDNTKIVGILEYDESELPEDPSYCFSIGYKTTDSDNKHELVRFNKHELVQLALVDSYTHYLSLKEKYDN